MLAALAGVASAAVLCGCSGPSGPPTYYLSPSGSDSAAGTSPATAWRTLAKASGVRLPPGSRLLLRGGSRFAGQLRLGPHDAGNPRDLVSIGSYGTGRATIAGTGGSGLVVYDTAGVAISDLNVAGAAPIQSDSAGILLFSTRARAPRLARVLISGVDVSGFGTGIGIGAAHDTGFSDVEITDATVHGNLNAGLASYGGAFNPAAPVYANSGIVISDVTAWGNLGDPVNTSTNSGNGIVLGAVSGASVTRSTAYGNGGQGGARLEGPEGIWAYDARDVRIAHNLSYRNNSGSRVDGGGFGLDQNTVDSTMEYNLAYGNHGPGFLVFGSGPVPQSGTVVRFNISSGDALTPATTGSIMVLGGVKDAAVYQNTVVAASPGGAPHAAVRLGPGLQSVTVRNNLLLAYGSALVVLADLPLPASAVSLQGNAYFSASGAWAALWGPTRYSSLAAWRAGTGQERVGGKPAGLDADPRLTGPVLGLTVSSAADADTAADGFVPIAGSPVRGAGLDLGRLFGVRTGGVNFTGQPIPASAPNIGAQLF